MPKFLVGIAAILLLGPVASPAQDARATSSRWPRRWAPTP
jgi:hypothetical protein